MKTVILTGGEGTRLKNISRGLPKPLVPIGDKPVLEHQILLLKRHSLTEIILSTGYGSGDIWNYCGTGEQWGVKITYSHEETPLGTGGAIKILAPELTEDFLLLNGDIMIGMNLQSLITFHRLHSPSATLVVHPSSHPHDSDLMEVNPQGRVVSWYSKSNRVPSEYPNIGNAGIYILSPQIIDFLPDGKSSLEKDGLVSALEKGKKLMAYNTPEYIKDMGTEERYSQVTTDYEQGLIIPLTKTS
ncbi:MAG: nucleotidyltransferase family protein [bacterium]|nr:nucleotidyltransferase family protein [bacterium]